MTQQVNGSEIVAHPPLWTVDDCSVLSRTKLSIHGKVSRNLKPLLGSWKQPSSYVTFWKEAKLRDRTQIRVTRNWGWG